MPYKYPRTLLINVPDHNDRRAGEPLGFGYLKAFLEKHNFTCDILDANFGGSKKTPYSEIPRLAAKKKYDLIGMTVFTHLFYGTMNLAKEIKKLTPKTKIVLGGHHVTFTHKDVLQKYPFIDFIVRGEGELTLLDLVRQMKGKGDLKSVKGLTYRSKKGIEVSPPRPLIKDIDTLSAPARNPRRFTRQPKIWRVAALITSRGCPYRCSFCSISAFYRTQPGPSYRMRSPANIAREIENLVRKFGIKQIAFKDDNMLVDARRFIKVTDILESKGMSLSYNIIARPDNIIENEKYIPILKKRGFTHCEVGVEAGSDNVLKRYAKDSSVKINKAAMEILLKNKISFILDYIMFDPDMTLGDFRGNINFIKTLGITPFLARAFVPGGLLQGLDLHPGTSYYERMRKEGRLKKGIFRPKWDFKDKDMGKAHKFIRKYVKTLRKKIRKIRKLRREKLIEANIRLKKKKIKPAENKIKRGILKHLDYELERVYLELLDMTVTMGKKYKFSNRAFTEVKKAIEQRLKNIKGKILTTI